MEIIDRPDGSILLADLDGIVADLLRKIPDAADPAGDSRARARMFQHPGGSLDPEDWQELVHPELARLFAGALDLVREALDTLPPHAPGSILIGPDQIDAWLNALNQARLTLAERHRLTEEEIETKDRTDIRSPRDLALLQLDFYGFLQQHFIMVLERGPAGE